MLSAANKLRHNGSHLALLGIVLAAGGVQLTLLGGSWYDYAKDRGNMWLVSPSSRSEAPRVRVFAEFVDGVLDN